MGKMDLSEEKINMTQSINEETIMQQELIDYQNYKKKYSLWGILLGILMLLISKPIIDWFFIMLFKYAEIKVIPKEIMKYISPLIILFVFLAGIFPMIINRWKIYKIYKWTKGKQEILSKEIDKPPKNYLTKCDTQESQATIKGPPPIILIIVFSLLGLFMINEFTEVKPINYLMNQLNIGNAQKVSGRYEAYYEQANISTGLARANQTWAFEFYENGKYTTYLEGTKQFSGTWHQSGNTLTVNFPAIPGLSQKGYSVTAKVSSNASYFIYGDDGIKYEKVSAK